MVNYTSDVRPGLDKAEPIVINVSLNLVALTKLNEVEGYISTIQFFDITWIDERITWNPDLHDGISFMTFRSDKLWTPELIISNPADKIYTFNDLPTAVRYNSDGVALWRPGLVTKTLCDIQTPGYPFDVHACYINIILWGTLPSEIIISSPLKEVITDFYSKNSEWCLSATSAFVTSGSQIQSIIFGLQFSRKSTFLIINVLVPIVFLSLLNSVVFLLPQESGERVTFSVTVLLSFTVFLNVIGDNVPKTSSPMPLLCYYVVIVLLGSGIITLLATLFQRISHTRGNEQVPRWLQHCLCFSSVKDKNKIVCSSVDDKKTVLEAISPTTWKEVIARLDIIMFFFSLMVAIALATGFITSMTKVQSNEMTFQKS